MKNLTWSCHVCDEERSDEKISVASAILKDLANAQINIRYCNDNATCEKSAKEHARKGQFPEKKDNRVKCFACNKHIHIDDFGGVVGKNGKTMFFHDNYVCLIIAKLKGVL